MKPGNLLLLKTIVVAAAILLPATMARAAQADAKSARPATPPAANAAPADPVQAQAVFVNPRTSQEGRDPFFPRSNLPYTRYNPPIKSSQPASVNADLRLGGISGSAERRLAIINNRTFETGEEADVSSGPDRVRIRCLEIKPESVIIQFAVGGARREIHLRRGL